MTVSNIPSASLDLRPSGDWRRLTPENLVSIEGLRYKLDAFEPLDHPAGHAAAAFLNQEAIDSPTAVTRVLIGPDRIEGFIATSFGEVQLNRRQKRRLGVTRRLSQPLPAFRLLWVARHRDSKASGLELVAAAYGFGCEAAERGGLCAFVLDPWDVKVAELWKAAPYFFEESETEPTEAGVPRKLWTPLG